MKSVGPLTKSFSPEKEQIEFECAGAAVAMASTCSCVRGSVPGGPLTSPAKATPAVRLKKTAAQIRQGIIKGEWKQVDLHEAASIN